MECKTPIYSYVRLLYIIGGRKTSFRSKNIRFKEYKAKHTSNIKKGKERIIDKTVQQPQSAMSYRAVFCTSSLLRMKPSSSGKVKKKNRLSDKFSNNNNVIAHRVAKQDTPWWKPFIIGGGVVLVLNAAYLVFSGIGTWRKRRRLEDTHTLLTEDVEKKLRERLDLASTAVRMTAHYLLSNASTPFGAPMISPVHCKAEAEELAEMVASWHAAFPAVSIPDLWALVSSKAMVAVGGPRVPITAGRERRVCSSGQTPRSKNASEEDHVVILTPTHLPERCKNVRELKRVLSEEGLSLEQMVALLGVTRSLGPHEEGGNSTERDSKMSTSRERRSYYFPPHQCTTNPHTYSNQYFQLLLGQKWKEEDVAPGYYRCRSTSVDRGSKLSVVSDNSETRSSNNALHNSEIADPCSFVAMKSLDILLLEDAGTKAFVQRFSQNQNRMDYVVASLFDSIHQRGHNVNHIYEVT